MPENIHLPGFVHVVIMEDPIIHDKQHPFCSTVGCPCHRDRQLVEEYILKPFHAGLMSDRDALRLYWGKQ